MAIAVGSVSNTPTYGTRTNSTITAPSGITDGDLLVAVLHVGDPTSLPALTVTPPTGFTEITNSPSASAKSDPYTIAMHIYYKVASGESGNYTFTHTSAESEGYMYRLTGCNTSTPIDVTPVAESYADGSAGGQTSAIASMTTVTNGAFIIAADSAWDAPGAGNWSGTTPTLTTRRTGSISKIADGTLATAGATGARTRTNGNGSTALTWSTLAVAIRPATGGGNTNLTADLGTFAITGQTAGLKRGLVTTGAAGACSITGQTAGLRVGTKVGANVGTFVITGQAAGFRRTSAVIANQGTFSLSGQAAGLSVGKKLTAAAGTFALTGQTANFNRTYAVAADVGAVAITGQTANFLRTYSLATDTGSVLITGQTAGLRAGTGISALHGAFAITGQNAGLKTSFKLQASAGSYAISGQDADLIYTPSGISYTLTANTGTINLTGQSAPLAKASKLTASLGTYAITGQSVGLSSGRKVSANQASYQISGQDVSFSIGGSGAYSLLAEVGQFGINGKSAELLYGIKAGGVSLNKPHWTRVNDSPPKLPDRPFDKVHPVEEIRKAAARLSSTGGHARAAALTQKQRTQIATIAAKARWK